MIQVNCRGLIRRSVDLSPVSTKSNDAQIDIAAAASLMGTSSIGMTLGVRRCLFDAGTGVHRRAPTITR
jgi:hypothetical protein